MEDPGTFLRGSGHLGIVGRREPVVGRKRSLSSLSLHPLQEHPECVPGTGSHPGAESRAAAQVCHAGHRHHAQAGKDTHVGPVARDPEQPCGMWFILGLVLGPRYLAQSRLFTFFTPPSSLLPPQP